MVADNFKEFNPVKTTETEDKENLILIGNAIDEHNRSVRAVIFNLNDYSYHSFVLTTFTQIIEYSRPIVHTEKKLMGYHTEKYVNIFNYITGDKIQSFELPNAYRKVEFSSDGLKLYYTNNEDNQLEIYSIETGELIEIKKLGLIVNGFKLLGINSYSDQLAFTNNDSLAFYSILDDSVVNNREFDNSFSSIEFIDNGSKFIGRWWKNAIVVNSNTFEIIEKIELGDKYEDFSYSNDFNYLYYLGYESRILEVYDTRADSIIYNRSDFNDDNSFHPMYISPDEKVAIGYEETAYYCGRYADMPVPTSLAYIYDWEDKIRLRPVPNTYLMNPIKAIFSDDNSKVAVTEWYNEEYPITTIVGKNKEFVKYFYHSGIPKLFINNSQLLAYEESQQLNFYDIESEEIIKSLDVGLSGDITYYYLPNQRKIALHNFDSLKVFDYDKLTLDYDYKLSDLLLDSNLKWDGKYGLTSYSDGKIYQFDLLDRTAKSSGLANLPDGFECVDFSPNGRYLLFLKDTFQLGLYDKLIDSFKQIDISNYYGIYSETVYLELIGNLPIYHHAYTINPIGHNERYLTYAFDNDSSNEGGYYPSKLFYSSDFKYQFSITCPNRTELIMLRDPISSVASEEIDNNVVYPNPTESYLMLDKLNENQLTNLKIFDSLGKMVLNLGTVYTTDKLYVNELTSGVYFLHSDQLQVSFVKE